MRWRVKLAGPRCFDQLVERLLSMLLGDSISFHPFAVDGFKLSIHGVELLSKFRELMNHRFSSLICWEVPGSIPEIVMS